MIAIRTRRDADRPGLANSVERIRHLVRGLRHPVSLDDRAFECRLEFSITVGGSDEDEERTKRSG
jgi:hypothetical protein